MWSVEPYAIHLDPEAVTPFAGPLSQSFLFPLAGSNLRTEDWTLRSRRSINTCGTMFHVSVERPAHHQRLDENDTPRPLSSHPVSNPRLRGQSEAGAEIPDIPLRRRPETTEMAGPWEDDTAHWAPHRGPVHKDSELASTIRAHDHFKMDNRYAGYPLRNTHQPEWHC